MRNWHQCVAVSKTKSCETLWSFTTNTSQSTGTLFLWQQCCGGGKNHQNVRPLLSNLRFGKMSPPGRLKRQSKNSTSFSARLIVLHLTNPLQHNAHLSFRLFTIKISGNIRHIQPLYSRSQPIDDAVRPQHYRVRPTDDARIKGHLKKKKERENWRQGGLSTPSLPDGVTWKRSSRAEGVRAQMEGA